jgi:hypothetical protein
MLGAMTPTALMACIAVATLVGAAAGWALRVRLEDVRARKLAMQRARVRSRVLPVLERRAEALRVAPVDRAPDEPDPIEAAIVMATAIERIEERRDLPFSDTLEVSKDDLGSVTVTRARGEGQ